MVASVLRCGPRFMTAPWRRDSGYAIVFTGFAWARPQDARGGGEEGWAPEERLGRQPCGVLKTALVVVVLRRLLDRSPD